MKTVKTSEMDIGDRAYDPEDDMTVYMRFYCEGGGMRFLAFEQWGNPDNLPIVIKDDEEVN